MPFTEAGKTEAGTSKEENQEFGMNISQAVNA